MQTGGTLPVLLSSPTVSQPTFTAPDTFTVLTFTLTVADPHGLADPTPDQVVVAVSRLTPNCPTSLADVSVSGPTSGYTGSLYAFTTVVTPTSATPPIAYLWDNGDTTSTTIRSLRGGTVTLMITATNCTAALVTDDHTIAITAYIYLPIILRR